MTQAEKAELLLALHHGSAPLVLPNVWDCGSARVIEAAGFRAIATTSAGVAFSLGYPDGQCVPAREMLAAVRRISQCVKAPVTADLEAGYGDVAGTAAALVECGAVGLNLEDAEPGDEGKLADSNTQVERIKIIRRTGSKLGVRIVINARTDMYLSRIGDPETRFERACERLRAYAEAGADCLFIPGISEERLIGDFVQALNFPVNILVAAGSPSVPRLRELGVARISMGSGIARAAMGLTRRIAEELMTTGSYSAMIEGAIPYAEANRLFESR